MRAPTPGQTIGPFFGYGLPYEGGELLVPAHHPDAIRLSGTVRDGDGHPVPDALVEIWQADSAGQVSRQPGSLRRDGATFTGFGRAATDPVGRFSFTTVRPGATRPDTAAFFAVAVFARGLLDRLFTRAYLPNQAALGDDPLLASVPVPRRGTLIAVESEGGLVFDISLQGDQETVFLRHRAD